MKTLLILCSLLLTGCASWNGLQPQCDNANEDDMGKLYAYKNVDPNHFATFSNQCAKYSYHTPSVEKFKESYSTYLKELCTNERTYFKIAYDNYKTGSSPNECKAFETARHDAYQASRYKQDIQNYEKRIEEAENKNKKRREDKGLSESNGFLLNSLLAFIFYPNPDALRSDQDEKQAQLKQIANKYNYYASEL